MAVRQGEISLRAHLDQTRGRALELVRLETFVGVVKRVGLGLGGGHELDRIVVKGIDQNDKAFGLAVDYLKIAREYHTVVLDRIAVMDYKRSDEAKRFIILIDNVNANDKKSGASALL